MRKWLASAAEGHWLEIREGNWNEHELWNSRLPRVEAWDNLAVRIGVLACNQRLLTSRN